MALLPAIFFCSVLIAEPCGASTGSGYGGGGGGWPNGGYQRRVPRDVMVNVINDLGLSLLEVHNEHNENNIAISPYGATSVLVALVEGLTGGAAHEIRYAIRLPQELSIVRIGLRDIHRHLKSYFIPKEGFLAGLTLSHENITLNREYESILRFYGYDVDSFNNPVYPEAFSTTPPPSTTKTAPTTTIAIETTTTPPTTTDEIARMETDETTETTIASTEQLSSLKPERTTRMETTLPDLEKEGDRTTKNVPVRETTKMDSTEDIISAETRYTTEMSTITQGTTTISEDVMKRESTITTENLLSTTISIDTTTINIKGEGKDEIFTDVTEIKTTPSIDQKINEDITKQTTFEETTELLSTLSLETTTVKSPKTMVTESTDIPEAAAMLGMTTTTSLTTTIQTTQTNELDKEGGDDSEIKEEYKDAAQDSTTKVDDNSESTEEIMLTSKTDEVTKVFKPSTEAITTEESPSSSFIEDTTKQLSTLNNEEIRSTTAETTTEIKSSKTDSETSITEETSTNSFTNLFMSDVTKETTDEITPSISEESTEDIVKTQSTNNDLEKTTEFEFLGSKNTATTVIEDLIAESSTLDEVTPSEITSTEAVDEKTNSATKIIRKRRNAEADDSLEYLTSVEKTTPGKYQNIITNGNKLVMSNKNTLITNFFSQDEADFQIESSEEAEPNEYKHLIEMNRLKVSFIPIVKTKGKNDLLTQKIKSVELNQLKEEIDSSFQIESSIEDYANFIGGNRLEGTIQNKESLGIRNGKNPVSNLLLPIKSKYSESSENEVENIPKTLKSDSFFNIPRRAKKKYLERKLNYRNEDPKLKSLPITHRLTKSNLGIKSKLSKEGLENIVKEFNPKLNIPLITSSKQLKQKSVRHFLSKPKVKSKRVLILGNENIIKNYNSDEDGEEFSYKEFESQKISPRAFSRIPKQRYSKNYDRANLLSGAKIETTTSLENDLEFSSTLQFPTTKTRLQNFESFSKPEDITKGKQFLDDGRKAQMQESINMDFENQIFTSLSPVTSTDFFDESYGTFQISANISTPLKSRKKRSVVDYLIARYYDNYYISSSRRYLPPPKPHYSNYQPEVPYTFLVNGKYRESNISFMTYDTVLPFYYIPGLDAMALSFPLDSNMYYLLLVLPVDDQGIDKLIHDFKKVTTLENIVQNLKYTHVKAVIPSFTLKGYVVLTPSLQKLCIRKIFEPRHADFSQLTPEKDIYVTNIEQAVTVTIRNYVDPSSGSGRNLQAYRPVEFKADHPFLYFVMDAQIHVNLMAGKITNPLNSRIR